MEQDVSGSSIPLQFGGFSRNGTTDSFNSSDDDNTSERQSKKFKDSGGGGGGGRGGNLRPRKHPRKKVWNIAHVISPYSVTHNNNEQSSSSSVSSVFGDIDQAQNVTLGSMIRAYEYVQEQQQQQQLQKVEEDDGRSLWNIKLYCAVLRNDVHVVPNITSKLTTTTTLPTRARRKAQRLFQPIVLPRSTSTEYPNLKPSIAYPFLQDIFQRTAQQANVDFRKEGGDGVAVPDGSGGYDYIIYTNADIGLSKEFYEYVGQTIDDYELDAFSINKIIIPTKVLVETQKDLAVGRGGRQSLHREGEEHRQRGLKEMQSEDYMLTGNVQDLEIMDDIIQYSNQTKSHPGYDCFVISRHVMERLNLGDLFLGHPPWGATLHYMLSLQLFSLYSTSPPSGVTPLSSYLLPSSTATTNSTHLRRRRALTSKLNSIKSNERGKNETKKEMANDAVVGPVSTRKHIVHDEGSIEEDDSTYRYYNFKSTKYGGTFHLGNERTWVVKKKDLINATTTNDSNTTSTAKPASTKLVSVSVARVADSTESGNRNDNIVYYEESEEELNVESYFDVEDETEEVEDEDDGGTDTDIVNDGVDGDGTGGKTLLHNGEDDSNLKKKRSGNVQKQLKLLLERAKSNAVKNKPITQRGYPLTRDELLWMRHCPYHYTPKVWTDHRLQNTINCGLLFM